jgi:hypothetical protein
MFQTRRQPESPIHFREMDCLAHVPLIGEPEDEPKAD